jgi:hypothetical protein
MNILNLCIGIIALVIAVLAYQKAGGGDDLRKKTIEILAKMEKNLKNEEEGEEQKKGKK